MQKPAEVNTMWAGMNIHALWGKDSKKLILKLSSNFYYKTKFSFVYNFVEI